MPISTRFVVQSTIVLLAIGFVTLLGIVGMTIWLGERAQVYFNEAIEARDMREAAADLRSAVQTAESSQRGFMISGNEVYLAPYDNAKATAQRRLDELRHRLANRRSADAMLQRLDQLIDEKFGEMDQTIALKVDRREAEAMSLVRSNRGKALMDEANVFLSAIMRDADERLTEGLREQRTNASMLRWVSIVGAAVIVLVIGGVIVTFAQYTREIAQARDEVRLLNTNLEERVARRTADVAQARDRAEVLLAEVNHRVANSLSLVASLVKLQGNALTDQAAKAALDETYARILAISLIHKRLYTAGDVRFVALDEYLSSLCDHLETSMRQEGHGASLTCRIEPLKLRTDAAVNLGIIVAEWVTNAFKYAYPDRRGEVRVGLRALPDGNAELVVEDDGIGRREGQPAHGTGLGTTLVNGVAATMTAEIQYLARAPGTAARLTFPLPAG